MSRWNPFIMMVQYRRGLFLSTFRCRGFHAPQGALLHAV